MKNSFMLGAYKTDKLYNSFMLKKHTIAVESILPLIIISTLCYIYRADLELLNIAMLYLLPILYTATKHEQLTTLIVSIVAVLLFDVLFVPPFFKLTVHNAQYLMSFTIFIIVGQLVSILASQASKAKELETSEKLYESILGSLSHELRTPLAVVIGATSTLLSKELELADIAKSELCDEAYTSAKQMQELVENLLASARFESGGVKPNNATCSISEIVSSALLKVEKKYSLEAIFSITDELPSIQNDAILLEQAFYNLLDNAFKYGSNIKVDVECSQNDIFVNIFNSGKMPNEIEMMTIGKKFSRLSNSTSTSGLGLGLFLSKKIIDALGGTLDIRIENEQFCVYVRLK